MIMMTTTTTTTTMMMSIVMSESVCVCVYVRDHVSGNTRPIVTNFVVHVTYGRGSVVLWRRSDTLRISGFVDDVIFADIS